MCNLVPKLRNATLRFLKCEPSRAAVAAAIRKWNGDELETAMTAQGIPLAVMREPEEWLRIEQGIALQASPLIQTERVSEAPKIRILPPTLLAWFPVIVESSTSTSTPDPKNEA